MAGSLNSDPTRSRRGQHFAVLLMAFVVIAGHERKTLMFNIQTVELDWGGRPLKLETGKIARQADGAVMATYGETVVLATVVAAKTPREGVDFLPLTVDYQEKTYAAGRIPGGYFKREGRPTEKETLVSRLIDRPIRPLFADGWRNETQVIITVLSHDMENDPDVLAMVATSAALTLSGAPFMGPIGAARVGFINNEFVLNPTLDEMTETQLELVVAGTNNAVLMVESEAKELPEEVMLGAVMFGHRHFQPVIEAIIKLAEKAAKEPRDVATVDNSEIEKKMLGLAEQELRAAYAIPVKQERYAAADAVKAKVMAHFFPEGQEPKYDKLRVADVFKELAGQDRSLEHPRHRQAHRRPRHQDRPHHRRRSRRAAARSRLGAVHPRRDAGAGRRPRSAPARTSSTSTRCRARTRKRSCCTTTSLPTRSARPAVSAVRAAAISVTASWPGARCVRFCRRITSSPTRCASSRRSPSRTARRRWRPCAAPRSR